jgi:type IV secretory pathway VirD2 relaxase
MRVRARRVTVKARVVKLRGSKAMSAAAAHLRYVQRDGVTREGEQGRLYSTFTDDADGKAFLERAEGDRHQFRFIVSPEDGAALETLRGFTRDLMARMEEDLRTNLDWVAVDHFDTGHPHTHVLVRGVTVGREDPQHRRRLHSPRHPRPSLGDHDAVAGAAE